MKNKSGQGWLELILGLGLIVLGIWMIAKPDSALGVLAYLYGFGALVSGISDIALYVRLERRVGFAPGMTLVSGILSALVGIAFLAFPQAGQLSLTLLFPVWFIAHCVSRLGSLDIVRLWGGSTAYYLTLILGVLGFILGIVMLFNPLLSILSISAFAAVYLIATGAASVYLGISWLRKQNA